jgi:hypothetical protein
MSGSGLISLLCRLSSAGCAQADGNAHQNDDCAREGQRGNALVTRDGAHREGHERDQDGDVADLGERRVMHEPGPQHERSQRAGECQVHDGPDGVRGPGQGVRFPDEEAPQETHPSAQSTADSVHADGRLRRAALEQRRSERRDERGEEHRGQGQPRHARQELGREDDDDSQEPEDRARDLAPGELLEPEGTCVESQREGGGGIEHGAQAGGNDLLAPIEKGKVHPELKRAVLECGREGDSAWHGELANCNPDPQKRRRGCEPQRGRPHRSHGLVAHANNEKRASPNRATSNECRDQCGS